MGSLILSGSEDTYVNVWDLRQRRFIRRMCGRAMCVTHSASHTEKVNKVVLCPTNDNYFISLGADKDIRL